MNYSPMQILYNKDVQLLLKISKDPARKIINDVKQHYNITLVTYSHLKDYLKIP